METKTTNPELDITKFVNIDDSPFDIYINGKLVRHIEPKEEQQLVLYVAQVGAKHLVDRILQIKHAIKNTLQDTDLRRSLFAQILPEMAEERNIKPLSEEDFRKTLSEELKKQAEVIAALQGKQTDQDSKDKKIADLENRLAELEKPKADKKTNK